MTKLTKAEKREYRQSFENWRSPADMLRDATGLMERMGSVDLFTQSGVDFITEAWAAAKFAKLKSSGALRLVSERDQWPDFQLYTCGGQQSWEFTEADLPLRRRGDQYREQDERIRAGWSNVENDPVEIWSTRAEQVPVALREAVKRKPARRYGSRVALLIYLNIDEYGIRQREIEASFTCATAAGKNAFTEIWVPWKDQAYPTWRDGHPATTSVIAQHC